MTTIHDCHPDGPREAARCKCPGNICPAKRTETTVNHPDGTVTRTVTTTYQPRRDEHGRTISMSAEEIEDLEHRRTHDPVQTACDGQHET